MKPIIFGFVGNIGSGKTHMSQKYIQKWKSDGYPVTIIAWADPVKKVIMQSTGMQKSGVLDFNKFIGLTEEKVRADLRMRLVQLCITFGTEGWAAYERKFEQAWDDVGSEIMGAITRAQEDLNVYQQCFRIVIQRVGTDLGRAMDPDLWIKETLDRIEHLFREDYFDVVFIDDIRFVNEYQLLKDFCKKNKFVCDVYGIDCSLETRSERTGMTVEQLADFDLHPSESAVATIKAMLPKKNIIDNN